RRGLHFEECTKVRSHSIPFLNVQQTTRGTALVRNSSNDGGRANAAAIAPAPNSVTNSQIEFHHALGGRSTKPAASAQPRMPQVTLVTRKVRFLFMRCVVSASSASSALVVVRRMLFFVSFVPS